MSDTRILPERIARMTSGKKYKADAVGMSESHIRVYDDCVLKITKYSRKNEDTAEIMQWLEGKIPVPKVLCFERDSEYQYLLMSRIGGRMACDSYCMERPGMLLRCLAESFEMLWNVDVSLCPRDRSLDIELKEARYRVENDLVDIRTADPSTFGKGGFKDPEELLEWLENNRPDYEPVLSHGDLCLPNIFIENGKISGFIDLGDTGIADKWRDISLCYRSLKWNSEGIYGGKTYPDIRPEKLFDALGTVPDPDKLRYYILLDELF